jgi:putative ATP-dependent endonuclease of OLD family
VKIRRLAIKNVTSYRERTEFVFDPRLNILIGPNGGGKTNLQKIIALTLSRYFIHQYQFRRDDNVASVDVLDPWAQRRLQQAFPKFVGDDSEQIIEIELVPESRDVENIKAIGGNLEKFNNALAYWEKRYETYGPLPFADRIGQAGSFTFVIRNLALAEPESQTPAWAFREYLREFFIFQRVVNNIPDVTLSSPVFFFSSDRALSRNFEVQAGQLTDQAYFDGARSAYHAAMGENMNLMQWATQHFVRLHRRAVNSGASVADKTWRDFFDQFTDVQLLNRYLEQLGYKWGFRTDNDQLSYFFVLLAKDGKEVSANMFSSGEREIVHFLLAMFALNVQDGLILVDEPELHLHPRWQKIFLDLFRELAPERNNQFVITTHSPAFVTPETIDSVTRVYRPSSTGTAQVALRDVDLPAKKSLVRMINSQNNERIFFADKVVLVEGISDRLVLETLLANASARFHISTSIEIIEVGGKRNFADYNTILTGLRTETFTVTDRDYLTDARVGSPEIRALFVSDSESNGGYSMKARRASIARR